MGSAHFSFPPLFADQVFLFWMFIVFCGYVPPAPESSFLTSGALGHKMRGAAARGIYAVRWTPSAGVLQEDGSNAGKPWWPGPAQPMWQTAVCGWLAGAAWAVRP